MISYFYRNNVPDFITALNSFYTYRHKATSIEMQRVTRRNTQRPKVNYWLFPVHQHFVTEIIPLTHQTSFNRLDRSGSRQKSRHLAVINWSYWAFRRSHLGSLTFKYFKTFFTFCAYKSHNAAQVSSHKQTDHWNVSQAKNVSHHH